SWPPPRRPPRSCRPCMTPLSPRARIPSSKKRFARRASRHAASGCATSTRISARTWIGSSRCSGPSPARTRACDARLELLSHHAFASDRAAIHLEFELSYRRPRVVPCQPGARRAAPHDLVGEERIEVAHGVDLRRRGVRPAETERRQPALHLAEHVARLLAHRFGTAFAAPDGAFAVASASLPGLG